MKWKCFGYFCVLAGYTCRPVCSSLHLFWQPGPNECFFLCGATFDWLTENWTALWGKIKYFWLNWVFHGFLYWIWLSVWTDWTHQPKKIWHWMTSAMFAVRGKVRGKAAPTRRWRCKTNAGLMGKEPFVPAVIGFLNHSEWDQQPSTNFSKSIDISPNRMTICTQQWWSLSWQMVSHPLRNSQRATARWGGVTAGVKKGTGLLK